MSLAGDKLADKYAVTPMLLDTWEVVLSPENPKTPMT